MIVFRRAALVTLTVALASGIASAQPVRRVVSVVIPVSDLDRSVSFFTNVLTFEKLSEQEESGPAWEHLQGVFGARTRVARLKLGEETIELAEYLAPRGRPVPADSRSNDAWFQHIAIVVRDMGKAFGHLRAHGAAFASTGPQRLPDWSPNAGGIQAFYFKDPDGHALEVIWFPAGKGDPRWQRPSEKLFLGIDHTAIAVSDTERSLKFWRDTLGLRVAGTSENWGEEQEHLNNVFGARLAITGLRAADGGPGIEFLEYLSPRDGRTYPLDTKSNDLWSWQTRVVTSDAEGTARSTRAARAAWVSPGLVELPDASLGYRRGLTVRDPDGHEVLIGAD